MEKYQIENKSDYIKILENCKKTFKKYKGYENNTFLCSGGIKEILANLYIIKKAGGGILYLRTSNTENKLPFLDKGNPYIKPVTFSNEQYEYIKPLLEAQPYIKEVREYNGEDVIFDLDCYRLCYFEPELLSKTQGILMLALKETWGIAVSFKKPWIEVPETKELDRTLFVSRSLNWHGGEIFYSYKGNTITNGGFFVGNEIEYITFTESCSCLPWRIRTKDMLELAESVKISDLVIVNDCDLYWLALGLGVNEINYELCPDIYTGICDNNKVYYFLGDTFVLPDVPFIKKGNYMHNDTK